MSFRLRLLLVGAFGLFAAASVPAQVGPIRVACVGNSITYGGLGSQSYPQQLGTLLGSHYDVRNFGVSGRTMLRKGDYPYWNEVTFFDVQDFDPEILVICLGTNDSKPWNWVDSADFYTDYMDFVKTFRNNGRHPQIYACFPPPVFQDGFGITNATIRDRIIPLIDSVRVTARTLSINFYQLMLGDGAHFPDGIHPDAAGYAIMAQIVHDSIVSSPAGFARYFTARSPTFEMGESDMLYWETSTGSNVTIDGVSHNGTDSMLVSPSGTTTYTLIASGAVNTDTSKLTLQYFPPGKIKSFTADFPILDVGGGDSCLLSWRTSKGSTVFLQGQPVAPDSSRYVAPTSTSTYTLVASGNVTDTARVTVQVLPSDQINRVLRRPVKASSTQHGYSPDSAFDGSLGTRWVSQSYESQWLLSDLQRKSRIKKIVLSWGDNFALRYRVGVSTDSVTWSLLWSNSVGIGGTETKDSLNGVARYLKLFLDKRASADSGYVLREVQVYGSPAGSTAVEDADWGVPDHSVLYQNYPNPFNPSTLIRYTIVGSRENGVGSKEVKLVVCDLLGREVAVLVNEKKEPGSYSVRFDASGLASGVYFYRLIAGGFVQTKRLIVLH
jgi:acyl-CoA thioesterase-1